MYMYIFCFLWYKFFYLDVVRLGCFINERGVLINEFGRYKLLY